MQKFSILLFLFVLALASPSVFAQSGTIQYSNLVCPPNSSEVGSVEISWSVSADAPDDVTVDVWDSFAGYWQLYAAARSGDNTGNNWIQLNDAYYWLLQDDCPNNYEPTQGQYLDETAFDCVG